MATVAQNKQDVENMTRKDRLWDSLNHAYGQQREESNRSYDQAISQADRRALSRGMQRSSYNNAVLSNLSNQKIKAQENSWNNQIADYENRLGQLESEEAEADRWERQFAANREDTAWNQNFQITQADRAADQWERQFAQGNNDTDRQLAASYVASIVANGGIPSDDLLARAGLSRADAELMAKKSSGGGGGNPNPKPTTEEPAQAPGDGSDLFPDGTLPGAVIGNGTRGIANGLTSNLAERVGHGFYGNNNNGGLTTIGPVYSPPSEIEQQYMDNFAGVEWKKENVIEDDSKKKSYEDAFSNAATITDSDGLKSSKKKKGE